MATSPSSVEQEDFSLNDALATLQQNDEDPVAHKLVTDIPILRRWLETPRPPHAVTNAKLKLALLFLCILLLCILLLCFLLLCLALRFLCSALLCIAFALLCFALDCIALLCFAFFCFALPCAFYALPCFALLCIALHCFGLLCFSFALPCMFARGDAQTKLEVQSGMGKPKGRAKGGLRKPGWMGGPGGDARVDVQPKLGRPGGMRKASW